LRRRNRHILTDYGFLHEQDNTKLIRTAGAADTLLVAEKGLNMYKRTEDQKAGDPGKVWWEKHRPFWQEVLAVWREIYSRKKDIAFREKGGDGKLAQALFKLDDESLKARKKPDDVKAEIRSLIESHFRTIEIGAK
jgi:hypothetical protein